MEEILSHCNTLAAPAMLCNEKRPAGEFMASDTRYPRTPKSPSVPTQAPQEEPGINFTCLKCWVLVSHRAPAKCSRLLAAMRWVPVLELSPCPCSACRGQARSSFLWQDWSCLQEKPSLC